ncbi:MAG: peptidoglycan editing factor PgeF [Acutalibacteraceae bacterium]
MEFNSKKMKLNEKDGVYYLTHNNLSQIDFINHAFSTKLGGVSKGEYATMNLAFGRGDDKENVTQNYRLFSQAAGFDFDTLVSSKQDHHTVIRRVTKKDCGIGIWREHDMPSVDGLITNEKGVTLVTHYADCTPIFFVDTAKRAIGAAHGGWRGTVSGIAEITVKRMTEEFGTVPGDLVCAIGPAISRCCYEVDEPVFNQFNALTFLDRDKFISEKGNGKYIIDLLEVNRQFLIKAGVKPENISVGDVCTKCNSDLLFSHRATAGKRGGMVAMLALK